MGYATSIKTIDKVRDYLDTLVEANGNIIWKVPNPNNFAYSIREAIYASGKLGVKKYASLAAKFAIKVKGDEVIARHREFTLLPLEETIKNEIIKSFSGASLNELVLEISKVENKNVTTFKFPHLILSQEDTTRLYKLANNMNLEVLLGNEIILKRT